MKTFTINNFSDHIWFLKFRDPKSSHNFSTLAISGKRPEWIVAAELVETSRLFGRCVGAIRADWIEPLARHVSITLFLIASALSSECYL